MEKYKSFLRLLVDKAFISGFLITMAFLVTYQFSNTYISYSILEVSLILCLFSFFLIKTKKLESYAFGILCAVTIIVILYNFYQTLLSLFIVEEWDFLAFYLYGKLGASGLDFYEPANIADLFSNLKIPFEISKEFLEDVIDVGFNYPPVSMILFAPFAYLDIETANILWKIFVLFFLILDIILLIRIFKTNLSQGIHIIFILTLILIFPSTISTLGFGQTNFLLLFFLLLSYKNTNNWKSGLYLALAVVIKPISIIWCLYIIINKKWSSLISLIITGILLVSVSGIWFGFNNFESYLTSPPTHRLPQWVYTESINQSLLATISRFCTKLGIDSSISASSIQVILSLILSGILTVLTCIGSYNLAKVNEKLSFLIFIPLSLIIYPGTLYHYSLILIPVFFVILSVRNYRSLQFFSALILILFFCGFIASFIASLCILLIIITYSFLKPQAQVFC